LVVSAADSSFESAYRGSADGGQADADSSEMWHFDHAGDADNAVFEVRIVLELFVCPGLEFSMSMPCSIFFFF
jgi:hypothetical protein